LIKEKHKNFDQLENLSRQKISKKMLADYIQCKNHSRGQLAINVGLLTHLDSVNDATKAEKT